MIMLLLLIMIMTMEMRLSPNWRDPSSYSAKQLRPHCGTETKMPMPIIMLMIVIKSNANLEVTMIPWQSRSQLRVDKRSSIEGSLPFLNSSHLRKQWKGWGFWWRDYIIPLLVASEASWTARLKLPRSTRQVSTGIRLLFHLAGNYLSNMVHDFMRWWSWWWTDDGEGGR